MKVFVLDKNKSPLMPCTAARARKLLKSGRAVVARRQPFTIRLKDRKAVDSEFQSIRLKFDPGSKVTGIAIVREAEIYSEVVHLAELHHRQGISAALQDRAGRRRRRRSANLRYRPPRWQNRKRPKGWLAPSLRARVDNVKSWTDKYQKLLPVSVISVETVRFDTQKLVNPEVEGVGYQQGELFGYEVREYLLEKWGRQCAYCDGKNVPLQIEHIHPKSRGGSDRVSNLTISCQPCNMKKNNQPVEQFLANDPKRLKRILAQAKAPLKDATAVNSTRWAIYEILNSNKIHVEMGSGGRTKFNRINHGLPKTHAYDALCVGASTPDKIINTEQPTLKIVAVGRGKYQVKVTDKYGFPRTNTPAPRKKMVNGIKTNDYIEANILTGKFAGFKGQGYVVIRHKGNFKIKQGGKVVAEAHPKYFRLIEKSAGYTFEIAPKITSGASPQ